jgi:hypothetical protein
LASTEALDYTISAFPLAFHLALTSTEALDYTISAFPLALANYSLVLVIDTLQLYTALQNRRLIFRMIKTRIEYILISTGQPHA